MTPRLASTGEQMDKYEKRVIHGLYFHREHINEEMIYDAAEINWLVNTPIPRTKKWAGSDGKLQRLAAPEDDYLARLALVSAASKQRLAYLSGAGMIDYTREGGSFRVTVRIAGADKARELDSVVGRINDWYVERKDGVLSLIVTVAVSVVTALITSLVVID
jgi:hypothetical protein